MNSSVSKAIRVLIAVTIALVTWVCASLWFAHNNTGAAVAPKAACSLLTRSDVMSILGDTVRVRQDGSHVVCTYKSSSGVRLLAIDVPNTPHWRSIVAPAVDAENVGRRHSTSVMNAKGYYVTKSGGFSRQTGTAFYVVSRGYFVGVSAYGSANSKEFAKIALTRMLKRL